MNLPTIQALAYKKPLLLYLALSPSDIGALIGQEDEGGIKQLVYYISRALKDVETRYPRLKRVCIAIFYASQRLRHYFLAYKVHLMTKSYAIKSLLRQPILSSRIAQWLLQLSQYDLKAGTPKAGKSQVIADLLAQFPREEEFLLNDKVPREVATAEVTAKEWVMRYDGSFTADSRDVGVFLYHREGEIVVLSFKLEFSCSNNTTKYKAYLTGLVVALKVGVQHLRVIGDSNLWFTRQKEAFPQKSQTWLSTEC